MFPSAPHRPPLPHGLPLKKLLRKTFMRPTVSVDSILILVGPLKATKKFKWKFAVAEKDFGNVFSSK